MVLCCERLLGHARHRCSIRYVNRQAPSSGVRSSPLQSLLDNNTKLYSCKYLHRPEPSVQLVVRIARRPDIHHVRNRRVPVVVAERQRKLQRHPFPPCPLFQSRRNIGPETSEVASSDLYSATMTTRRGRDWHGAAKRWDLQAMRRGAKVGSDPIASQPRSCTYDEVDGHSLINVRCHKVVITRGRTQCDD
jgi:hypothetical protein